MCDTCDAINTLGREIQALGTLISVDVTESDYEAAAEIMLARDSELSATELRNLHPAMIAQLIAVRCAMVAGMSQENSEPLSFIMGEWAGSLMHAESIVIAGNMIQNFMEKKPHLN